jgi:Asp-tRNA(Asn)/Glu-tRNA(Gln) amidotransferase A subunit family amidase
LRPTATKLARQVRDGSRPARDVVEVALAAAISSNDELNAFTSIDIEGARTRAEAVDRQVAMGRDPGPLAGVPIALKDLIDQAGITNTKGSNFPSPPSPSSATVVRRLGNAGGVVIGRTGLHEFAFGFTSENPWFGPVRNPWNLEESPGGSSGGSAAAVAAGVVPVAIGTDTGGSVRVPAAMCGVFGLKVTHGRIPLTGVYPLAPSLDTVGPIAATVDDLALAYLAMAGDDPADPWSQLADVEPPDFAIEVPMLTVGIVKEWNTPRQSRAVALGVAAFVDRLVEAGAEVIEIDNDALAYNAASAKAFGAEVTLIHAETLSQNPEHYGPETRSRIADASGVSAADLAAAHQWRSGARAQLDRIFASGVDVIVTPTVGAMHKAIGDDDIDVDGERLFHRPLLSAFTAPMNQVGVPAIVGPIAGAGSPGVSVQMVGPRWSEARLLSIAKAIENVGIIATEEPPTYVGETS